MAYRKNAAAWVVVVACMAAAVAAAGDKQQGVSKEMMDFCAVTGFAENCMNANITQAKELIKKAFDIAVAEIRTVIKNTTFYKGIESDRLTRGALEVCENVLQDSIDQVGDSMDKIMKFEVGKSTTDTTLDVVKIWLSAAITFKDTCHDAFAKTRGKSKPIVREMLKTSGHLLNKGLAMVIEFQKAFQSISKTLGSLVNRIKSRQLLADIDNDVDEIPDFVGDHARKLIETPKISLPPNLVVAPDDSGDFKTIMEAVDAVTARRAAPNTPFVIKVKAGIYNEYVTIPKGLDELIMIGEGPTVTRITGDKNFKIKGIQTFYTATLVVEGRGFVAKDIGIENTSGPPGDQAVAVRTTGDVGVFYNVHFDGYQDTLYAHVQRQLFRECRVSGTIDFIFGNGIAVFQKCELVVRKPGPNQKCMVTAQGRTEKNVTDILLIQGCRITAEKEYLEMQPPVETYLGRPWKDMSRTVIMQSTIGDFINPAGWAPMVEGQQCGTLPLFYMEYNNKKENNVDPVDLRLRVNWNGWQKDVTEEKARPYTPLVHFVEDKWIYDSGVPYAPEFI